MVFERVPSCNQGLKEDFARNRCVPTKPGEGVFSGGFESFANLVAKGSDICRAFFNLLPRPPAAPSLVGEAQACQLEAQIGFRCAAPQILQKFVGAGRLMGQFEAAFNSRQCRTPLQIYVARARFVRKHGCPRGSFLDIGLGQCFSCPRGYIRTATHVRAARACARNLITGPWARATYRGRSSGCPRGSFLDIGLGQCWACPTAYVRSITHVRSSNACIRATGPGPFRGLCAVAKVVDGAAVKPIQCFAAMMQQGVVSEVAPDPRARREICYAMGEVAFDFAVKRLLGNPDLKGTQRKLARAMRRALRAAKKAERIDRFFQRLRSQPACRGVF